MAYNTSSGAWSLAYDGSAEYAAWGVADLDAVHGFAATLCLGDFNEDGDVDGNDLFMTAPEGAGIGLESFVLDFGRANCRPN